jgi:hypothetical protein
MMVLPIQGLPGGKKGKKNKGGKKAKGGKGGGAGQGDVQVNLIVDPEAFGRRDDESDDEEEDEEWDDSIPGQYDSGSARKKRRRARRRGVFAGLAMEEEWKGARAWAKKLAIVDGVGLVLWGAAFVFIMIGKRCPSGGFEGWYVLCSIFSSEPTDQRCLGAMHIMFPLPLRVFCAFCLA